MDDVEARYSRQSRFAPIGERGQAQLQGSTALICGCGALGSLIAERLVRAGVGCLRIVDRDWVEWSNLQRQAIFTEADAKASTPKAIAACLTLKTINSQAKLEPWVEDLDHTNIRELAHNCDVVLDGTDNFETRFLINDYCVRHKIPWIHGGCLGAGGQILTIVPHRTACFRCLVPELPPREALETCDSAGVLGSAIGIIASWQAGEAIKILSGNVQAACEGLIVIDSWNNDCRIVRLPKRSACPTCGLGEFPFLSGDVRTAVTVLCGKNAVQIESPMASNESLEAIAAKIRSLGEVTQNAYFVRLKLKDHTLTIFRGGRTVVEGTTSEADAKSLVSQTIGS